jgi:hypothetical protein
MLQCRAIVLLSFTEFVLGASLQNSLRGLDEKDPSFKPLHSADVTAAQNTGEDLSHQLQRFGTHMLRDFSSSVQDKLSKKEEPVYDAPLRKFGGDASKKNDTAAKQENDLPADPDGGIPGLGDAISEREKTATENAPGAGTKAAPKIPGQGNDPLASDAGKKRSTMEKEEEAESGRSWQEYGNEKWEEMKEYAGWGDKQEGEQAKGAGEKIDREMTKSDPEHEMVPVPTEAPEPEVAATAAPPETPTEAPEPEVAATAAPPEKRDAPIAEPGHVAGMPKTDETWTAPPELGLPEDAAVSTDKKASATENGIPTGRGGARMAQPWIFSLMMIGIIVCFCCGVCGFARYARSSFRKTEDELQELLEKVKSTSMNDLMNEHAYGTPTPVPILRARHLVKKARDDQEDAKKDHRVEQYTATRQAILDESYKMRVGKSKEELQLMDEEIRRKLRVEKEKIRAATIKDWAEGTLPDPVPSLPEAEAWLAKMEKRWQELQMQST